MSIRQNRLSDEPDVSPYIPPDDLDHGLNEDWERGPIALNNSSEGMAYQNWHLTYNPVTAPGYNPDMMQYDGVTGYYDISTTTSGNLMTIVGRFSRASFTGGSAEYIFRCRSDTQNHDRLAVFAFASDFADLDKANTINFLVRDNTSADLCRLITPVGYLDGNRHTFMFSFDGDNGTAQLIIDGVDADDVGNADRTAPIVGTPSTGTSEIEVGAANTTPSNVFGGQIGYLGYKDAYLTNWSDFMDGSEPKQLDEVTWTQWGGQPAFWNQDGEMTANLGSAGNMTQNGTITKVSIGDYQYFALTPDDTGVPITVLSGVDSAQCTFCFDQNGQPAISWIDSLDRGFLWWFDIQTGQPEIIPFQAPVTSVGLCLDDKRPREVRVNDMLLWYTIPTGGGMYALFYRQQRDRFDTPYPLADPVWPFIHKLGMNSELRVQVTLKTIGPT